MNDRRRPLVVWSALCAAAFLFAYTPTLERLARHFATNDMYSYGFLVPVISGYLFWLRWPVVRRMPLEPSMGLGSAVLGAGLVLLVIGRVSNTNLVEELSLPISIWGVSLLVIGRAATRAMTFPLAYLFAMVPFWDAVTARMHPPFQLYSATLGVGALRLFDVPVLREGILIRLPNITLEVADACSGVNHVVAVLCIGVPMTYLHVRAWSRRIFILATAMLIALFSNGLRVAMVSLFAYYEIRGADGDVHGPFALLRSLLITAVGFAALFWLIGRFADRPQPAAGTDGPADDVRLWPMHEAGLAAATLLIAVAGALATATRAEAVPLRASDADFPAAVGRWRMVAAPPWTPSTEGTGFDRVVSRTYAAGQDDWVDLLAGYFERQEQGRELVGVEVSRVLLEDGAGLPQTPELEVRDFVATVRGRSYHVTTWYVVGGRVVSGAYEAKWRTAWNTLVAGRSDGGVVVVRALLRPGESVASSRARVADFVSRVIPISERYFGG